jgi:hypothetical protein
MSSFRQLHRTKILLNYARKTKFKWLIETLETREKDLKWQLKKDSWGSQSISEWFGLGDS